MPFVIEVYPLTLKEVQLEQRFNVTMPLDINVQAHLHNWNNSQKREYSTIFPLPKEKTPALSIQLRKRTNRAYCDDGALLRKVRFTRIEQPWFLQESRQSSRIQTRILNNQSFTTKRQIPTIHQSVVEKLMINCSSKILVNGKASKLLWNEYFIQVDSIYSSWFTG